MRGRIYSDTSRQGFTVKICCTSACIEKIAIRDREKEQDAQRSVDQPFPDSCLRHSKPSCRLFHKQQLGATTLRPYTRSGCLRRLGAEEAEALERWERSVLARL